MIKLEMNNLKLNIEKPQWVIIQAGDDSKLKDILDILQGKSNALEGEYHFQGKDVGDFSQRQLSHFRKNEAINISEKSFLMQDFTVEKNLQMQLKFSGVYPTKAKRRVDKILEELEIKDLKHALISELNLFHQLQIKLAKAMVVEPKLICCFSPFSELKDEEGEKLSEWIRGLVNRGTAVVMVTTDSINMEYGDIILQLKIDDQIDQ